MVRWRDHILLLSRGIAIILFGCTTWEEHEIYFDFVVCDLEIQKNVRLVEAKGIVHFVKFMG